MMLNAVAPHTEHQKRRPGKPNKHNNIVIKCQQENELFYFNEDEYSTTISATATAAQNQLYQIEQSLNNIH